MIAMKRWRVEVFLGEQDGHTYAEARLHTELGDHLLGVGRARLNPHDYDVPEIGDEVAVARALTDLGHRLLITAAQDIEQVTNEPVRLTH
jgi:sorbitol-specific phosphotransferase system component IIA